MESKIIHGYPKRFKNCAVCDYWGGNHQTSGKQATVDSLVANGKYLLQGGPWQGQNRQANSTCHKWKAWGALK